MLSLPAVPHADLSPTGVVLTLCKGLKYSNVPTMNAGIRRVYEFTSYECRAALTSRKGCVCEACLHPGTSPHCSKTVEAPPAEWPPATSSTTA